MFKIIACLWAKLYRGMTDQEITHAWAERVHKEELKALNILKKIKLKNACSIATADQLTTALHREHLLGEKEAIRFKPLFGRFDLVNADWRENGFDPRFHHIDFEDVDDLILFIYYRG